MRITGRAVLFSMLSVLGLWFAIHRVPWLGPALADGARAVVGPAAVAWLEDVAYGAQDHVNLWRYRDAKPVVFWKPPQNPLPETTPIAATKVTKRQPSFSLARVEPPYPKLASAADGVWVPVSDARSDEDDPSMYKTLVHPDARRGFAALAIIAMDVNAFELHLVAGTREPKSRKVARTDRTGLIPIQHHRALAAAFNGGFKATHGHYGMMLAGVEYLPPRGYACTFVRYDAGELLIGTWSELYDDERRRRQSMTYYRQTPPCLVADGKIHNLLRYHEYAKGWGATVSGETVIRRSAIGLNQTRKVLFYGLGEAMTAKALAVGMQAVGAHWVAELDVNHSYPRFLFYEQPDLMEPPRAKEAIIPAIQYAPEQYVSQASLRDFFYLTRVTRRADKGAYSNSKMAAK